MYTFVIFLGSIPTAYASCIESIKQFYPDLVTVTSWGDCPYDQPIDPREASDILRMWIMSQKEEALYFDADMLLTGPIPITGPLLFVDLPEFGSLNYCMMYHNGQQAFFTDMLKFYESNKQMFWPMYYLKDHRAELGFFDKVNYKHLYLTTSPEFSNYLSALVLLDGTKLDDGTRRNLIAEYQAKLGQG